MKPVSIKLQKMIAFIPALNILCIPIWLYNSFYFDKIKKTHLQCLMIIMSSAAPLALLQMVVDFYFPYIGEFLGIVNAYLIPTVIGLGLINLQKEIDAI